MIDISVQASLSDDESERVEEVNHTLTLDVEDPFKLSTQVMYRHASKTASDGVEGWATVMGLLSLSDKRGMTVESIEIEAKVSKRLGARLMVERDCHATYFLTCQAGTRFPTRYVPISKELMIDWHENTVYSLASKFALVPSRRASTTILGPSTEPSAYIVIKWRR